MAQNNLQKIITVDISVSTEQLIKDKLAAGYAIQHIISLLPKFEKLLIVYSTPETFGTP